MGKTIERVESKTPLRDSDIKGTITWHAPDTAVLADNKTVVDVLQVNCENDNCTANSNPTAYNLTVGSNTISVSGTVTVDGKTIDLATDVKPITEDTEEVKSTFTFQTGTLPEGLTLQALVDALNQNKTSAHGTFDASNTSLRITCDNGYGWLRNIDPPYGEFQHSDSSRGVAQAVWDVDTNSFYSTGARDIDYTTNGNKYRSGANRYTWNMGCWPDQ
ncbi:hypothetical protein FN3523_0773 [Francisella hispaniensis]|uniref:Uncharacterized protein n=1 Tax=Francisella hispaniensis TaxID=622488 RepID=F4BKD6_9GAMM|nr:hypothetical protein FN3523_0773 [Francisella hispaniensis]